MLPIELPPESWDEVPVFTDLFRVVRLRQLACGISCWATVAKERPTVRAVGFDYGIENRNGQSHESVIEKWSLNR